MKRKVLIFSGPTATGKTALSIKSALEIEKSLNHKCCIINFDSLAFYKELLIGSARVKKEDMHGIKHYLVGTESIKNPVDAHQFKELAEDIIHQNPDKILIFVGGSGFYIRALIKGMYETTTVDSQMREELNKLYNEKGITPFIEFLEENDPESLEILHENDHYRIMRAVEFFKANGQKISESKKQSDQDDPYDFSQNNFPDWEILHIYLDIPRPEHFEIIQKRTWDMIQEGLIDEVENLIQQGFTGQERPLQSIGYKEAQDYIEGKFKTEQDLAERISISTRQLAKAQRTFFKKVKGKETFHPLKESDKVIEAVKKFIE
ncbi:MAG: tRNA (adenosine(37)-N6)-dimethylallyltransferase MiaA [Bdellovibrionales bacterium]|jgi:tRNA dimethylallyltransferase|nr:tRNA (adenosine(37)-N6)-dimethylallyltransferase MiaA [Bdellovibrionales bacterium]